MLLFAECVRCTEERKDAAADLYGADIVHYNMQRRSIASSVRLELKMKFGMPFGVCVPCAGMLCACKRVYSTN